MPLLSYRIKVETRNTNHHPVSGKEPKLSTETRPLNNEEREAIAERVDIDAAREREAALLQAIRVQRWQQRNS